MINLPHIRKKLLSVAISALVVSACGGGGSGTPTGSDSTGGTSEPTRSTSSVNGRITGFGSVIVNGVHFEVDGANILHDGVPITEGDLKVGMIIRLSGNVDEDGLNGTATEIEYDEEVKGPVQSIDLAAGSFVVLGQTVLVDDDTVFDEISLSVLEAGNLVEVSGYTDADGDLRATFVELKATALEADEEIEAKGVVRLHDAATKQFMVRNLLVDYSSAELEDFPEGTIADGMKVEVKGQSGALGEALSATKIEYEERDNGREENKGNGKRHVEGLVTSITSLHEFAINDQTIRITDSTEFEDGSADSIYLNTKIKVKGQYDADGVLVAEEVKLRRRGDLRLETVVDAVDLEAATFTVVGAQVQVTPTTVWEDESADDEHYFSLAHLVAGDRIKIRGYQNSEGVFIATAVERKDSDDEDEFELEGPATDVVANGSFKVLGVTVSFDENTEFEADDEVSIEQFFAALAEGGTVKVEGQLVSATELVAEKVELEMEDDRDEFGGERDRPRGDRDEGQDDESQDGESRDDESRDDEDRGEVDEGGDELKQEEDESAEEAEVDQGDTDDELDSDEGEKSSEADQDVSAAV